MNDHSSATDLKAARLRADEARTHFSLTLRNLRERISPSRLKEDATSLASEKMQSAKKSAQTAVRRHPIITGAATFAGLALFFWRPARLLIVYGARGSWLLWLNRAIWSRNDK